MEKISSITPLGATVTTPPCDVATTSTISFAPDGGAKVHKRKNSQDCQTTSFTLAPFGGTALAMNIHVHIIHVHNE